MACGGFTSAQQSPTDHGTREELAIANFWADGPSTPTPPGHWNFIAQDIRPSPSFVRGLVHNGTAVSIRSG